MKVVKIALHWQMCISLVLGAVFGFIFSPHVDTWNTFTNGVGNLFLHAINMIVIPLVFLSTLLGISTLDSTKYLGRIASWTFGCFFFTALLSAILAIITTVILRPGYGTHLSALSAETIINEASEIGSVSLMGWIVNAVPKNIFESFSKGDILPILIFSILLGYFLTRIEKHKRDNVNDLFVALNDAIMKLTNFIIRLSPYGVFAIVMTMIGQQANDIETFKVNMLNFAYFVLVVWISLLLMGGVVLPCLVSFFAGVSPLVHIKKIYSALVVAFSTSSTYSALPILMRDAKEKCGVSQNVTSFTMPLGITFNKIGTIIYECVAVMFVAQAANVELSLAQQSTLIGVSIITVLGVPSVPMTGVVVLAILLKTMGLPLDYIGMFMAIDILCDMPRSLLNAYSISCNTLIVAKQQNENLALD